MFSCAPGKLPCGEEKWQEVCALEPGGQGGGGGGGGGGQGGTPGTPEPTASTAVMGCPKYPTLGDMDKFFSARCGVEGAAACHPRTMSIWQDLNSAEVWKRLADKPAGYACKPGKVIDTAKWDDSVLWAKAQTPVACAGSSGPPGDPMPHPTMMPMMAKLDEGELACLEGFLKALQK